MRNTVQNTVKQKTVRGVYLFFSAVSVLLSFVFSQSVALRGTAVLLFLFSLLMFLLAEKKRIFGYAAYASFLLVPLWLIAPFAKHAGRFDSLIVMLPVLLAGYPCMLAERDFSDATLGKILCTAFSVLVSLVAMSCFVFCIDAWGDTDRGVGSFFFALPVLMFGASSFVLFLYRKWTDENGGCLFTAAEYGAAILSYVWMILYFGIVVGVGKHFLLFLLTGAYFVLCALSERLFAKVK